MTGKNILFNDGWQFCLTENFAVKELSDLERQHWYNVELPHDWLVVDTANLYKSGDGWYRKIFTVEKAQFTGKVLLNFDGVYHVGGPAAVADGNDYVPFRKPHGGFVLVKHIGADVSGKAQPAKFGAGELGGNGGVAGGDKVQTVSLLNAA